MVGMGDDEELPTQPPGRLSVFYYGAGHMLNDITAACWFTYLLLFLTDIGLSHRYVLNTTCGPTILSSKLDLLYPYFFLLLRSLCPEKGNI